MRKQIILSTLILSFLILATILVILYGRGYTLSFTKDGKPGISGTGLLVATSTPNGASVFINGHLTTATDNTINLTPGTYDVKIYKEGYFPWEKKIKVSEETVSKAEALLFSAVPKLESLTSTGVEKPVIDPSFTKIAYSIASQSAKKNGIYIMDLTAKPILTLQSASTQITDDTFDFFSKANLSWSPDGKQILATISAGLRNPTTYALETAGFNEAPKDVTEILDPVKNSWLKDKSEKSKSRFDGLKKPLQKVITDNFITLSWSPDETKILYQASRSADLPIIIKPRLIGADTADEERTIKKDSIYVYDIKEDKNFKVLDSLLTNCEISNEILVGYCHLPLNWLSDSKHLIYVSDKKINIMDYDGTNTVTVFAGPFIDNYVFPWTSVSKIVMLTDLGNPDITPNLYTIELK